MHEVNPIEGESWERWLHEIRRIEFDAAIGHVPLGYDATVLELGSGDGLQLDLLRHRFTRVFAIDPERRPAAPSGFVFAHAESLPFPDGAFDLVFSCHVVEHIQDRARAMAEVVRVVRPRGYVVHAVPTQFWKATSLLLNPVGYPLRVMEKWRELRKFRRDESEPEMAAYKTTPRWFQVLGRWFYPPVHGSFPSHRSEFRSFSRDRWREALRPPGLVSVAEIPLLSYTQFGFARSRLLGVRTWLAQQGFASSHAFIFQKS